MKKKGSLGEGVFYGCGGGARSLLTGFQFFLEEAAFTGFSVAKERKTWLIQMGVGVSCRSWLALLSSVTSRNRSFCCCRSSCLLFDDVTCWPQSAAYHPDRERGAHTIQ